jgi:transglutaminase-like putative cysteine protease
MPWLKPGVAQFGQVVGVNRVHRTTLKGSPQQASMATLEVIHSLVREGREDPVVRDWAIRIIRQARAAENDKRAQILAVGGWVKNNLYYVNDPINVETIATARVILEQANHGQAAFDCDDFVVVAQSLLNALGINTRSVIIKADHRDPSQWTHIYFEAHDGQQWIPLDLIMKQKPLGWAPPRYYAKKVVEVGGGAPFPTERLGRVPTGMTTEYLR